MKKISRQYEKRVKQNAVMIFLLAILMCGGMIYYIINVKNSINSQRENIKKNENNLSLTNSLIEKVNKAQSYANLYISTGNENHLDNFNIITAEISAINDSIVRFCNNDFNDGTLNEICILFEEKKNNIEKISKQLNTFNPYKEIHTIINDYKDIQNNTTVSKTIQDTIIYKTEKKSFFQRLGEVFSPDNSLDSLVLVSKTTIDTISEKDEESAKLLNDIQIYTEKGRKEYLKQIELFESKYNNLTLSDQKISKEISELLLSLHKGTLDSVIKEIQKSEIIINKNINLSISIAIAALLTILTFIFFILYDVKKVITARKATEEAKRRTEEIMESRHKLLLSVSHDIKSPLSSILGYLELMQIDSNDKEEKRIISSMKNSADHILSLLTNLLNFSKLDQGKETLITSTFCISKLCDEITEMFRPLASNKHLNFIYNKDFDDNIHIKSDALKIKQILSNILSNAIKYTIKGDIRFSISKDENNIIFNISDQGIGIPDDKLEEIFKPFSRIDNNESLIEGNGFGLFVVKGLIDLLNGIIEVKSEVNIGSLFTITIPVEFTDTKALTEESDDIKISEITHKQKILVIDDDKTLLAVIESMLKKINVDCDICHSSIEFDEICQRLNKYDIVLTDREMGAFSGLDVLKKIKGIDSEKKVVLMTARSEYNMEVASEKGFDNYLRKPFTIKDLANILNVNIDYNTNKSSKYHDDFPELCEMFDDDEKAITDILTTFVNTTSQNIITFNEFIDSNDFNEATKLCHKMCPMFIQLNQTEISGFLLKMDKLRNDDGTSFPEWAEESIRFINMIDDYILYLSEKYDI